MTSRRAPLVVGVILITVLIGYVATYRSSPGELSKAHHAVAGSAFIMDCQKCHGAKSLAEGCLACHQEIAQQTASAKGYHGALLKGKPAECASCHSEHNGPDFALVSAKSWGAKGRDGFTHSFVDFQLKEAHSKLTCNACHARPGATSFHMAAFPKTARTDSYLGLNQSCVACHQDPHAGGKITTCTQCHNQKAWKPAPGFDHAKFFPLTGAHEHVSCNACHQANRPAKSAHSFGIPFGAVKGTRCIDCHASPHRAAFTVSCERCHAATDRQWTAADGRMSTAQHALTGFPLVTPHQKATCAACHTGQTFRQKYPDPRAPGYARTPKNCESCHRDPHAGQFVKRYPACARCHSLTRFTPSTFGVKDHKTYPLAGKHAGAACALCHWKPEGSRSRTFVGAPRACAACHRDEHAGQFRVSGTTACERCHLSTEKWKALQFDHNRQSDFHLDRAHANVACAACHPRVRLRNGRTVTQFKPIRHDCKDCHAFDSR